MKRGFVNMNRISEKAFYALRDRTLEVLREMCRVRDEFQPFWKRHDDHEEVNPEETKELLLRFSEYPTSILRRVVFVEQSAGERAFDVVLATIELANARDGQLNDAVFRMQGEDDRLYFESPLDICSTYHEFCERLCCSVMHRGAHMMPCVDVADAETCEIALSRLSEVLDTIPHIGSLERHLNSECARGIAYMREFGPPTTQAEECSKPETFARGSRYTEEQPLARFQTPPGARWGDVRIRFLDGETVSVKVDDVTNRFLFSQMGMITKNNKKPTVQWCLLRKFCETEEGILHKRDFPPLEVQAMTRQVQRLSSHLKEFFDIGGKPILVLEKSTGWQTAFRVSPE